MATNTFTNAGSDNNWETTANWSLGVLPVDGDVADMAGLTANLNLQSSLVDNLTITDSIGGGNVYLQDAFTLGANFTLAGQVHFLAYYQNLYVTGRII